jgi:restriction endonuclease Mrr
LPPRQKEIFKLAYVKGVSTNKIAKQLNIKLQTVSNHRYSALKTIRRFLDGGILDYKNEIITNYSENKADFSTAPPKIITDIRVINNNLLEIVRKNPGIMHNMQPWEFEMLVGQLFESKGYHVTLTPKTRDGGKDLIVAENSVAGSFLYYVECKRNAPHRCVSVNVIRELHGTVISEKATAGIVVTSSYFSDPAREFTKTICHQMSLIDYTNLCKLIKNL